MEERAIGEKQHSCKQQSQHKVPQDGELITCVIGRCDDDEQHEVHLSHQLITHLETGCHIRGRAQKQLEDALNAQADAVDRLFTEPPQ